jgi:hypothetical protein
MGLLGSTQSATDSLASAAMYGAAAHSIESGLTVPLRSSIVRGLLTTSETLGKVSGVLTMVNVVYALGDAVNAELNSKACYSYPMADALIAFVHVQEILSCTLPLALPLSQQLSSLLIDQSIMTHSSDGADSLSTQWSSMGISSLTAACSFEDGRSGE